MAEQRISELATISIESSTTEKQTEKRLEEKQNRIIDELENNYKRCNVRVMGIPTRREESKEQKKYIKDNY